MIRTSVLSCCVLSAWSFQPTIKAKSRKTTQLRNWPPEDTSVGGIININVEIPEKETGFGVETLESENVATVAYDAPPTNTEFDEKIKDLFSDALTNQELKARVVTALANKGYDSSNTLLATSLCCDELARRLENDFCQVYGKNFNLGGLSGFPFAGNTGFGAMSAHIPDDGYCLIVHGPHVGVSKDGVVGKVERGGIALVDNCCGSAIAASNYLAGITDGGASITTKIQEFTDFQQGAVQELILPYGKRLTDAENRMLELPYALYDSQDLLMRDIIDGGAAGTKAGTAVLGGIQINTGPDTPDYFHPLRFDYMNNKGEILEDMLPLIMGE